MELNREVYLREFLTGNAHNMVSYLQVSDQSYNVAWNILDEAYNHKRLMLDACTQMMLDPNFTTKSDDPKSKQIFQNTFEQIKGNFEVLKVTRDQLLAQLCLSRLDSETAQDFERFIGFTRETPTLQQIHEFLIRESSIGLHTAFMEPSSDVQPAEDFEYEDCPDDCSECEKESDSEQDVCNACGSEEHLTSDCALYKDYNGNSA